MSKKPNLEKLKQRAEKLREAYTDAWIKVRDLEHAMKVPELKRKYEGKYFLYQNTLNGQEFWPVYIYCRKVIDLLHFEVLSFEIDLHKTQRLRLETSGNWFEIAQEITKTEFDIEFAKFMNQEIFPFINS